MGFKLTMLVVIGTDCTGIFKITTTTAPFDFQQYINATIQSVTERDTLWDVVRFPTQ